MVSHVDRKRRFQRTRAGHHWQLGLKRHAEVSRSESHANGAQEQSLRCGFHDQTRRDNGSTRFVPGSHKWWTIPNDLMKDPTADHQGQLLACGPAGSVIVYNGSVWHGHTANQTSEPRRSIQGAYIRRDAESRINLPARMRPETLGRIGELAKYVLAV
jgi:ectoine hydroxylase-related dioxygenase (phytanoyl-CoA dioxygenase family)